MANAPNLDAIASAGVNGLMDPVEAGLGCGSDTAHLSLLGYDQGSITEVGEHLSQWVLDWPWHQETSRSRLNLLSFPCACIFI